MFFNPFRDTYVERQKGESANDRNDRAIREASLWYKRHLEDHSSEDIDIVLLTNDEDNRTKAKAEGLQSFTGKIKTSTNLQIFFLFFSEIKKLHPNVVLNQKVVS